MLGKGLESLIPNKYEPVVDTPPPVLDVPPVAAQAAPFIPPSPKPVPPAPSPSGEAVYQIEVEKIQPNPHQPRKTFDEAQLAELAVSVREFGIIQPLIVTKIERETPYGTAIEYQLVAGERRLMAAKLAGLPRVPAVVRCESGDREKFEMAIVENIQRADLNPIDTARSYAKLQEKFGLTQREVAARMGKSREVVANALRLLNLPSEMQEAIAGNKLSESQGRVLLAVSDPAQQRYLFEQVTTNNVSVRELKSTIAQMNRPMPVPAPQAPAMATPPDTAFVRFEEEDLYARLGRELQAALRAPVRVERAGMGGRVTIDITSEDDLRALVQKLREVK